MKNKSSVSGSFRDPHGHMYIKNNLLYRQMNNIYRDHYEQLMKSGLYDRLLERHLLISHVDVDIQAEIKEPVYKIIQPEIVPFVSYPHEWCFSQLKDAAITTLLIQKLAIQHGMILKDASAYNIQFINGKPILIDTLSFEKYEEGRPWVAYRQFCQHFLAPLVMMSYMDYRLGQLFKVFIDGPNLDFVRRILPSRVFLRPSLFLHLYLHAMSNRYASKINLHRYNSHFNRKALLGLINNLLSVVNNIKWKLPKTEWSNYYQDTHYSASDMSEKRSLVSNYVERAEPRSVWDLGANVGTFSRISSQRGIQTISFDADYVAVEMNYNEVKNRNEQNILPLVMDLSNPTPNYGWALEERTSLFERGPADAVFALALMHHLCISNNVPFEHLARFFHKICKWLIIEFIPINDPKVQMLMTNRKKIHENYSLSHFHVTFGQYFKLLVSQEIGHSGRYLYLCEKHEA